MPGIYVRKTNWIDWTQREENPNLTVPGSYWLCHKNDIYKFIFRYHRANRTVTEFSFGKELMKVIRRIIKNLPAQGQQFSTSHLLITFNLTWWNKQDKLIALLKFNERSVNTFPHAFILTIKLNSPRDSEKSSKSSPQDHCFHCRDQDEESVYTNEDTNKLNNNLNVSFEALTTSENDIPLNDEINDNDLLVGGTNLEDGNTECESSPKRDSAMDNEEKSNEQDAREDPDEQIIVSNTSKTLNDDAPVDDSVVDSANLPYQYLIEKEIETTGQNTRKRKLGAEDRTDTRNCAESQPDGHLQDSPHFKKRKYEVDNSQRSSDITDLVMEGLMFTIRQGQDTVAVIEQKTKLEMDEVLENSEKVETEEGEKRLRNSSLLGLENLITMIEFPNGNKFDGRRRIAEEYAWTNRSLDNKINERSVVADLKHTQHQTSGDRVSAGTSSDYVEPGECVKSMGADKGEREEELEQIEEEQRETRKEKIETVAEEDEDIIPEALQNDVLQSYLSRCSPQNNNTNIKYLSPDKIDESTNESLESVNGSHSRSKRKSKMNSPIIISNQLITINEIPSSLRVILEERLSNDHVPSNNPNEVNEANEIETQGEQQWEEEGKTCAVRLESDSSNAPCTEQTTVNDDRNTEKDCESKLSAPVESDTPFSNITGENVKLNEEVSKEGNKIECSYSGKLKDITKDFHKNIEYLQKKRNTTSEKSLRPRRKSLHLQNATSDCEIHVQMSKFFEDITRGAKVLVKRIDLNKCS